MRRRFLYSSGGSDGLIQAVATNSGGLYVTKDGWRSSSKVSYFGTSETVGDVAICQSNPLYQTALSSSYDRINYTNNAWNGGNKYVIFQYDSYFLNKIAICPTNPLYQSVATVEGAIIVTTNGWQTYYICDLGYSHYRVGDISISASNPLIQSAVSYDYGQGSTGVKWGFIWTTTDAWQTRTQHRVNDGVSVLHDIQWASIGISATNPMKQTAVSNEWTAGAPGNNAIWTTTDGWQTMTERQNIPKYRWSSVAISMTDDNIQTAVSPLRIATTTDSWNTYSILTIPNNEEISDIAISSTNPMVQSAVGRTGNNDQVYSTNDGWQTYKIAFTTSRQSFRAIAMN